MKSILIFTVLIGYVFGQHASCNMTLTISGSKVEDVNNSLVQMVQQRQGFDSSTCIYADQENEFCGYSVVSLDSGLDHFKHETPVHHYVDDVEFFNFTQRGENVVIGAGSRSEPNSIYDYGM